METLTFRQPRLIVLALGVILVAGLASLMSIGRQEDPTITNIFATITTAYPGADPGKVEALVTARIEEALTEIPEIATVASTSTTGLSVVGIELADTTPPAQIDEVWSRTRDALDNARDDLPQGAQEPAFDSDGPGGYAAILALTLDPGESLTRAAQEAEALADALRAVPGTRRVVLHGLPEDEVIVTLDPALAAALGLTVDAVAAAIAAADAKVPAGRLQGETGDLVLGLAGEVQALDRLRQVVLRETPDGALALLGDVARISRGARTPAAEMALHQGRPAILISARLEPGLQVDVWMAAVRATVDRTTAALPLGLRLDMVFDQSRYTRDRLADVAINMAQGMALVVAVLFVSLGARAALIVAMVLPVVTLASLATLNALAVPIHQMSVTGLIVALGLMVDAAIVMTDEIGQRLQRGMARDRAVSQAVRRLAMPLIASTVTTILSFLPLLLLPGPAGDFVGSIATAVVVMLVWSLIVALAITPALAGRFLRADKAETRPWRLTAGMAMLFRSSLRLALDHPLRAVCLSLVLPVTGFLALPGLTPQFFPAADRDQFHIEVEMPPGTSIDATAAVVARMDAAIRAEDGIAGLTWVMGRSAPAFYYNMVGDRDRDPAFAQALVSTVSAEATAQLLGRLQAALPAAFPEARILLRELAQGPPVNAPVELRLIGPDPQVLRALGDEMRAVLATLPQVTATRSSITGGAPKLELQADEARARLTGLDLGQIARQVQTAVEGATGGSLVEGTEALPIRVRPGSPAPGDPVALADMVVLPPAAAALSAAGGFAGVPLSALGKLELIPAQGAVTRWNGERSNLVQAFLMPGALPQPVLDKALAAMAASGFSLPPGYRLETGGDADARDATIRALMAPLGLIVTLSVAVVALTFQSFRLTAVAFTVAGLSGGLSILALAVFGYPFGINAIIGLIGSIGVSVNAALIVLTGLQQDEAAAAGDRGAMAAVVAGSARHILSTTATTVGGFLPLILAGGGFWPPFAMAVAGGVALSALLAFWLTPPLFALVYAGRAGSTRQAEVGPA